MVKVPGAAFDEPAAKPGCMFGIIFGAIIGGSSAGLLLGTGLDLTWNFKSTDFLTGVLSALGVLLAAISVMLAIMGIFIALAAIYGYADFKRRTGETAAQRAADVAGPAAVEAAVPAAIKQVDDYLDKNLDPEIRQKVIATVGQMITPELIREMVKKASDEPQAVPTGDVPVNESFSADAVQAAAQEELSRQEHSLDAFDATVEADAKRGDDQPREDDV